MGEDNREVIYESRVPVRPRQCERGGPYLFTPTWLVSVFSPESVGPIKYVLVAAWAFVIGGVEAYAMPWKGLFGAWVLDMSFGIVAALRDRRTSFNWGKFGDGFLKLLVILTLPPVIRGLEDGWGTNGWVTSIAVAFLGLELAISALDNASAWWPGLRRVRALLVKIRRDQEPEIEGRVLLIADEDLGDGHAGP